MSVHVNILNYILPLPYRATFPKKPLRTFYSGVFIKDYLRYKTISSQNGSSEAKVKNFLIFFRKVMFRSQDIQVFGFLTIP